MKINYEKLRELNLDSLNNNGDQLSCYYTIQNGVESFLRGHGISDDYKNFLVDLGVLVQELQEERKEIVKPFNFMGDGTQSN